MVKEIHRSYDEYGDITEEQTVSIDMDQPGIEHIGAYGGKGGRGNQHLVFSESAGRKYFKQKKIQEEKQKLLQPLGCLLLYLYVKCIRARRPAVPFFVTLWDKT